MSIVKSIVLHRYKQNAFIQKNMPQIHYTVTNGHNSIKDLMNQNIYNERGKKERKTFQQNGKDYLS